MINLWSCFALQISDHQMAKNTIRYREKYFIEQSLLYSVGVKYPLASRSQLKLKEVAVVLSYLANIIVISWKRPQPNTYQKNEKVLI